MGAARQPVPARAALSAVPPHAEPLRAEPGPVSAQPQPLRAAAGFGPGQAANGFASALLGGDAVAASSYFAEDARVLTADGTEVAGRRPIQAILAQIVASDVRLEIMLGRTLLAGGVALHTQYWRRVAGAPPERFESRTVATLVLRQRGERWEIAIASPWG